LDKIVEKPAIAAGCILIGIFATLFAGCISSGTGANPVPSPAQPALTVTVPAREISEPATTPVQAAQPVTTGNRHGGKNPPPDGPVSITVHAARKVLGFGTPGDIYIGADPGKNYPSGKKGSDFPTKKIPDSVGLVILPVSWDDVIIVLLRMLWRSSHCSYR
jgi:hypothetical protein